MHTTAERPGGTEPEQPDAAALPGGAELSVGDVVGVGGVELHPGGAAAGVTGPAPGMELSAGGPPGVAAESAPGTGSGVPQDESPSGIKVAVIEDHPLYRRSVERVLAEAPDIVLGAVVDSVARFHVARQPEASVVLLDLGLPGVAGAAAVLEVVELGHCVLVVSAQAEPESVLNALAAGAKGFLSKDVDVDELLLAIRAVAAGTSYVSAVVAGMIIKDNAGRPPARPEIELSRREEEVLRLVAQGERDVDIAVKLKIGVRTVRGYLDRIRDKTGERRRPGLVKEAIRRGLVGKETLR